MPFAATQLVVPLKVHNGCGVLVATERFVQDFWNMCWWEVLSVLFGGYDSPTSRPITAFPSGGLRKSK